METNTIFTSSKSYELNEEELENFNKQGYLGPYTLIEEDETDNFFKKLHSNINNNLLPLYGRHSVIKEVAELSRNPHILNKVTSILGEDVMLWGSHLFEQKPCVRHPYHRDAEFTEIKGITVWLALLNVVSEETFSVIPGSHLFNISPQELRSNGIVIDDDGTVEKAARQINKESRLVNLNIKDGQYILFDGLLWHGTKNTTAQRRFSINLRFSNPSQAPRIAKKGDLPNTSWDKRKPLCLLVHGQDKFHLNKIISINSISKTKGIIKGLFIYLPLKLFRSLKNQLQIKRK